MVELQGLFTGSREAEIDVDLHTHKRKPLLSRKLKDQTDTYIPVKFEGP